MKKYQIVDCGAGFQFAGSKATRDAAEIAERLGYERCALTMRSTNQGAAAKLARQIGYAEDWHRVCREIPADSVVLLQHPFHYPQLTRERSLRKLKERGVRFICLVHDVEELRGYRYNGYYRAEFEQMLELADVLIVHNAAMKAFFAGRGVPERQIVELGIFDYLMRSAPEEAERDGGKDELAGRAPDESRAFRGSATPDQQGTANRSGDIRVVVAGRLDLEKSGYLAKLGLIDGVRFDVYGGEEGRLLEKQENVAYRGRFPEDEPMALLGGGRLRDGFVDGDGQLRDGLLDGDGQSRNGFVDGDGQLRDGLLDGDGQLRDGCLVVGGVRFGLVWDGAEVDGCSGSSGAYLRYNSPHKLSLYLACGLPVLIWRRAAQAAFVESHGVGLCVDSLRDVPETLHFLEETRYWEMVRRAVLVGERLRAGDFLWSAVTRAERRLE